MRASDAIQNTGSTARDHLANERTFLAWVRTGLGIIGLGVLLEKLVVGEPAEVITLVALLTVVSGVGLLLYAAWRYRTVAAALQRGEYRVARRSPVVVGLAGALLGAIAVWLVLGTSR